MSKGNDYIFILQTVRDATYRECHYGGAGRACYSCKHYIDDVCIHEGEMPNGHKHGHNGLCTLWSFER